MEHMSTVLLINSLVNNNNNKLYELFIIFIIVYISLNYKNGIQSFVQKIINKHFNNNASYILTGSISFYSQWGESCKLNKPIEAIMHYVIKNNLINNKIYYSNFTVQQIMTIDNNLPFDITPYGRIDDIYNLKIYDDIFLSCYSSLISPKTDHIDSYDIKKYTLKLTSKNNNNITDFLNKIIDEYNKYILNLKKNKIYHFVFQCTEIIENKTSVLKFSSNIISNLLEKKNYETFEHIMHEHTDKIKNDVDKLKDFEYYKKTGLKRKIGYLFAGPPGCGKTSTVMALSNYDNRHIIEIPFSRLKTNKDIENILNIQEINGIPINKNEIILLFDEIDYGYEKLKNDDETDEKDSKIENNNNENSNNTNSNTENNNAEKLKSKSKEDKLNLGFLLSRLDGIGNYDGLIIIATTNNLHKLDKALYRDGRLTLLNYNYCTKDIVIKFIEKYYEKKLSVIEINKIPDDVDIIHKISPAGLITLIQKYINNLDELLNYFSTSNLIIIN